MILDLKEWETAQGLELTPATVRALASSPAFSVSPDREATGLWNVTAQRYVGLMAVGDVQIRVAPKLPVYRLVELLCESMDLPNWRPEDVLWSESDDLLTTIAASFLAHAERALQFGLVQGYLTIEDDLYAVRGRIDRVERVGEDLFSEWEDELELYQSDELRRASERQHRATRRQYDQLIRSMRAAESKRV